MSRVTRLDNGLRVVTDPVDHAETATLGMWVGAGARSETADINGVAHMLEHMAFKGTRRRSARQIAEAIEAVGGQINAHTAREHTAYYVKVLRDDIDLGIDLLADILRHSLFDPGELERERMVVLQEIGQARDTPDDIVFDFFQETAFPDQGLGRPVLGRADIVRQMGREVLIGYMDRHYLAGDMVFAASGRIEPDRVVAAIAEKFGDQPATAGPAAEPAHYVGGDFRTRRDLEQVHLLLGFNGVPANGPDFYAAAVLSNVLGGGMSSRLFQEIRENRGLVYATYSFSASYADAGLFGVYAGTGPGEITELVPVLCDQIGGLADSLTEAEVARSRTQLKASLLMALDSPGARGEQAAQHLLLFNRVIPVPEMIAMVDAVDIAAVADMARRIFRGRPTVAALGPIEQMESCDRIRARLPG